MFEFFALVVRTLTVAAPLAFPNEHVEGDTKAVQAEPTSASMPATPMLVPVAFPGRIGLKSYTITLVGTAPTNGDTDGYADADETIDLTPTFVNQSNVTINHFSAALTTGSSTVECIGQSEVTVASIAPGATFTTAPFRFKIAGSGVVNRSNIDEAITAEFTITTQSENYNGLEPIPFTLHLDLNASAPGGPSAWVEGFEAGGSNFGKFTLMSLDSGMNSLATSDGMRCQYNNPDDPGSLSSGNVDCFLGFAGDPSQGISDWHVHDGSASQGATGRAYSGSKSLHWGVHSFSDPSQDDTRLKQLDTVKSLSINLPLTNVAPELTFSHQISLWAQDPRLALDRAVVQVNVLNATGQETGFWHTILGYDNGYDAKTDGPYSNCFFDPTDDGNDEDDFFQPGNPWPSYGPSSTCLDRPVFSREGSTDYRFTANPANVGQAYGPGLAGSIDIGTWVQSRFSLQEFAGRRIKIRFLASSVEAGVVQTISLPPGGNDGWYIDDVRVNSALGLPLTVTADTKAITPLPCPTCASVQAALSVTPDSLPGPGYQVMLSAYGSNVDSCPSGTLEYQFWIDENDNSVAGDAGDTLLRDFGPTWTHTFLAWSSDRLAVLTRCSSVTACDSGDGSNTATTLLSVTCPTGVDHYAFNQQIRVSRTRVSWPEASIVDTIRGVLVGAPTAPATSTLRGASSFTGTVAECLASNQGPTTQSLSSAEPDPGSGFYYLVRGQPSQSCAATPPGYTTNAPKERPGRDAEIDADPTAAACP